MKKFIAALAGTTLLAAAGAAVADESFVLGSESLDRVTAAGTVVYDIDVTKLVALDTDIFLDVEKNVFSTFQGFGNLADAEAAADAANCVPGGGCLAETLTTAQATDTFVQAFSQSIAGWSGGGFTGGGG